MYLERTQIDLVAPIIRATFPHYTGRHIQVLPAQQAPKELHSYWSGGSKDSFCFYNLDTKQALPVHTNHPYFEAGQPSQLAGLPLHIVLVEHTIFCGKDLGLRIYGNLAPLLPVPSEEVTRDERIVLVATRSLKNSYSGRTNIRQTEAQHETGITASAYDVAYAACIEKGYLTKSGALTVRGKNVAGYASLSSLKATATTT